MAARRAANSTIGAHLRSSFIRLSRTFNPPCVADVSPHCPSSAIPSTANFSQRTAGRIQSPPLSSAAPISDRIRNFSIVAHVDHGKSTLADRLLELTGTLTPSDTKGQARPQYLDKLQVERERGITVKAQTATMLFDFHPSAPTGGDQSGPGPPPGRYLLNLIDTPGHVDFSYEVSRSLAATQGVLLLVDAQQGIQAQTVANFFLALEGDLAIVPVVNKIDRPDADPQAVAAQIASTFDLPLTSCLFTSARTGAGLPSLLSAIVRQIPPPPGDPAAPLRALLLDAHFDEYRGVVCHVAVVDGAIREGEKVAVAGMGMSYDVGEVGVMYPEATPTGCLLTGQVCARVNVCVGERVAVAGMGMSYDVGEVGVMYPEATPTGCLLTGQVCARVNVCVGERVAVAGMGISYDVGEVGVMYPEATPTGCLLTGQVCARVNVCVGERVAVAGMGMSYDVGEVGVMYPEATPTGCLLTGQVCARVNVCVGERVAVAGMGMSYDVGEVGVMYPEATPTGCLLTGQVCARVNVCVGERVAVAGMGMSYDVGEVGVMYPEATPTGCLLTEQVCARVNVCVGERVAVAGMGMSYDVGEVGVMYPEATPTGCLLTGQVCARVNVCVGERVAVAGMGMSYDVGEVGYVMLGMRTTREARPLLLPPVLVTGGICDAGHANNKGSKGGVCDAGHAEVSPTREARVGDTIHHHKAQVSPLPGFRAAQHMVGYVMLGMRTTREARVGDTIHHHKSQVLPLPGFRAAQHMVFAGVFPADGSDFEALAKAVDKLVCNDASVAVTRYSSAALGAGFSEKALAKAVNKLVCSDASVAVTRYSSAALGAGFRCGFLGLLHMDVFHQRLQQEFGAEVISTAPSVPAIFEYADGTRIEAQGPSDIPSVPKQRVLRCTEPFVLATIVTPSKYVGPIMDLCASRRGEQKEYSFIDGDRAMLRYDMPVREVVMDFYSHLKSISSGFATFDYEDAGMREADLVKVDVLLNGKPVDALAAIAHRDAAQRMGRKLVERLKGVLDRWV
ncbi:unnamed protein product [Closterium sp. NIES-64]|nr:unnamed protein product [Closterium sp. NIES-64]